MSIFAASALAMLTLGHLLRAIRQAMLFPASARPRTFHLMVGLSIAYVANAVLPFRLGEIARAFYVSMRTDQRFGRVGATVIAERISDLGVVALLLPGLLLMKPGHGPELLASAVMMAIVLAGIIMSCLLRASGRTRLITWAIASVFNDRLRLMMVDMAWTTAKLLASGVLFRPRYLLLTVAMWAAYLFAYSFLGAAVGLDMVAVVIRLLSQPATPLVAAGAPLVLETSLAALVILLVGLLVDGSGMERSIRRVVRLGLPETDMVPSLTGAAFARDEDYGTILHAHFTRGKSAMASFGLHGLDGAVVQRLLPGGSDAITAVVEYEDRLAIRKFAFGAAGEKLAGQTRWLRAHRNELSLADVARESGDRAKFHFDMPYLPSARDFYEMIHVMPLSSSRALLGEVVETVFCWHERHAGPPCDHRDFAAYVDRKIIANARIILEFARLRLPPRYLINGVSFALDEWDRLVDPTWIVAQMPSRNTSAIHGDLTIENIVVCPERAPGWYLIDPNPGNLFDTPLIDWAKLMQSLNLGYETLNRGPMARMMDGSIDLMLNRSRIYAELHAGLKEQLEDMLGANAMLEISFHEIVNYLRLIPYKIRHDPAKAMTFFAAASILLRQYSEARDA